MSEFWRDGRLLIIRAHGFSCPRSNSKSWKTGPQGHQAGEIGRKLMIVFLDIIRLRNVFLGVPRTRQLGITTVSCEHHLFAFLHAIILDRKLNGKSQLENLVMLDAATPQHSTFRRCNLNVFRTFTECSAPTDLRMTITNHANSTRSHRADGSGL